MTDELLSTKQVALRYGICESTLRYFRHIAAGPASFKLAGRGGRRVVYRASAVDAWIRANEEATTVGGAP